MMKVAHSQSAMAPRNSAPTKGGIAAFIEHDRSQSDLNYSNDSGEDDARTQISVMTGTSAVTAPVARTSRSPRRGLMKKALSSRTLSPRRFRQQQEGGDNNDAPPSSPSRIGRRSLSKAMSVSSRALSPRRHQKQYQQQTEDDGENDNNKVPKSPASPRKALSKALAARTGMSMRKYRTVNLDDDGDAEDLDETTRSSDCGSSISLSGHGSVCESISGNSASTISFPISPSRKSYRPQSLSSQYTIVKDGNGTKLVKAPECRKAHLELSVAAEATSSHQREREVGVGSTVDTLKLSNAALKAKAKSPMKQKGCKKKVPRQKIDDSAIAPGTMVVKSPYSSSGHVELKVAREATSSHRRQQEIRVGTTFVKSPDTTKPHLELNVSRHSTSAHKRVQKKTKRKKKPCLDRILEASSASLAYLPSDEPEKMRKHSRSPQYEMHRSLPIIMLHE